MRFTMGRRTIPHREVTPVCRGPTAYSIAAGDLAAALGVPTDDHEALQAWCSSNSALRLQLQVGQSLEDAARTALERGYLIMVN